MGRAGLAIYAEQGKREKRELFKRYQVAPIHTLFKQRFFDLFSSACFKCGLFVDPAIPYETRRVLCMDHHIPMALGGNLVPGNIVSLCRRCNEKKLDRHPTLFYSDSELTQLQPILDQQHELFAFTFDWSSWDSDREKYLLSLGIDATTVHEVLHSSDHPDFVGTGSDQLGVAISPFGIFNL